jgi:hypothetical protein
MWLLASHPEAALLEIDEVLDVGLMQEQIHAAPSSSCTAALDVHVMAMIILTGEEKEVKSVLMESEP